MKVLKHEKLNDKYICNAFKLRETPKTLKMETLTCNKCNQTKSIDMFVKDGERKKKLCKACKSLQESERRKLNKEKYKQRDALYYQNNKEHILQRNKQYNVVNRDAIIQNKREYYQNNKAQILQYHQENKEKRNEKKRIKFKADNLFRISETLKARINDVLKNKKSIKSNVLIGCSKNHIKEWLQYQFTSDMSWDNYGNYWHIDHVVPISFFDLTNIDIQRICFNWTNLRPLNAKANITKSNKIICNDILCHINVLKLFPGYQANYENSWWRRVELRYGNNPKDEEDFDDLLKWAIRSQDPKSDNDKDIG